MFLSWFDASQEKAFGATLARFFMERSPLDSTGKSAKFIAAKQEALLGKMTQQVDSYKSGRRLNVYKKAQVGNVFKWTLMEAGYEQAYVDDLTRWLMLRF